EEPLRRGDSARSFCFSLTRRVLSRVAGRWGSIVLLAPVNLSVDVWRRSSPRRFMRRDNIRNVPDKRSLFKRIFDAVYDVSILSCCFVRSCAAKKFLKFLKRSADSKKCRFSLCFCRFLTYDTTHRRPPNRNKRTSRKNA